MSVELLARAEKAERERDEVRRVLKLLIDSSLAGDAGMTMDALSAAWEMLGVCTECGARDGERHGLRIQCSRNIQ